MKTGFYFNGARHHFFIKYENQCGSKNTLRAAGINNVGGRVNFKPRRVTTGTRLLGNSKAMRTAWRRLRQIRPSVKNIPNIIA